MAFCKAHSFGAEAVDLAAMGVEEAYEEEDAVDVDAMTYEARPCCCRARRGHVHAFAQPD
jgi:hypothetical protein